MDSFQASNISSISRDIAASIKHYCFNNISQFYERYNDEIDMAKSTFFRIMSGEYTSQNKINEIEKLAKRLGLLENRKVGSEWLVQKNLIVDLIRHCEILSIEPSLENLGNLKKFVRKYKLMILS